MNLKKISVLLIAMLFILAACGPAPQFDPSQPHLQLTLSINKTGLHYPPSCAVWLKDPQNRSTLSLFATKKAAAWAYGKNDRPSALPVWYGIAAKTDDIDAVTQPTPARDATIMLPLPADIVGKTVEVYVELNASFDYNDYYQKDLKSGEPGYSDVNGQPSLIYKAILDTSAASAEAVVFELVASGDVLGANHNLQTGLDKVTTAKQMVKELAVTYVAGNK